MALLAQIVGMTATKEKSHVSRISFEFWRTQAYRTAHKSSYAAEISAIFGASSLQREALSCSNPFLPIQGLQVITTVPFPGMVRTCSSRRPTW